MGREANSLKNRKCKICATTLRMASATELSGHVESCRGAANLAARMEAIGLAMPQLSVDAAELLGNLAKNKKPSFGGGR